MDHTPNPYLVQFDDIAPQKMVVFGAKGPKPLDAARFMPKKPIRDEMRQRITPLITAFQKHISTLRSAIEKEARDGDKKESEAAFKALTKDMAHYVKFADLIDDDTKLKLKRECKQLKEFCVKHSRDSDYEARLDDHMNIVFNQLPLYIVLINQLKQVCELNQETKKHPELEQDAYVMLLNILGYYHYVRTDLEKDIQDIIQRQFVDTVLSYQCEPAYHLQRVARLQSMCMEIFDKSYEDTFQVVIPKILDELEIHIAELLPLSSQPAEKHQLQYDFAVFKTILRNYAYYYIHKDKEMQFLFRRHLVNIVKLCEKYGQEEQARELKKMAQDGYMFGLTYDEILKWLDLSELVNFVPAPPPPPSDA